MSAVTALTAPVTTYREGLARGGIRLDEIRTLLLAWEPGQPIPAFIERVRRDDVLGKATARTVQDYVRAFAQRFLLPDDRPARHLRRLAAGEAQRQLFSDLVFYYVARQEALLRDFTVSRYWPAAREGRLSLSIDVVRQFLAEAELDGRLATAWSPALKKDMAARVLNVLGKFGLVGDLRGGRCAVLPYRPADGTVVYLAYLLHCADVTDASLAEQPAWQLFGLEPRDVWNRLDALAGDGSLILQRAGQVVRVTWKYGSLEEAVDVLARG